MECVNLYDYFTHSDDLCSAALALLDAEPTGLHAFAAGPFIEPELTHLNRWPASIRRREHHIIYIKTSIIDFVAPIFYKQEPYYLLQ